MTKSEKVSRSLIGNTRGFHPNRRKIIEAIKRDEKPLYISLLCGCSEKTVHRIKNSLAGGKKPVLF